MEAALNVAHQGMDAAKQLATGTAEAVSKLTTDATVQAADVSGAIRQSATYKKDEEGKGTFTCPALEHVLTRAETLDFAVSAEPSEDVLITLDCIVNELALDTDAPAFKPHVTLWRATMPIDTDPDVLIAEVRTFQVS